MLRFVAPVSAAAFAVFLAASIWLVQLDRAGPAHADLVLEGGVPATLYLPGEATRGRAAFLDPPPPAERPPAVVMMHGFAGDRRSMSGISRRIADAGYAVLDIDAAGHGANRNAFARSWATADDFHDDLAVAVDFLRAYPFVDGSRIAVAGYSMGAAASLEYASRDSGIDAAVMLSGGWRTDGPFRPANTLFLYASHDPERIRLRALELGARLAGVERLEPGRSYGRHDRQDAVRVVEVAGADHQTIVWREQSVREIVDWLDAAFAVARPPRAPIPDDPRTRPLWLLGIALPLLLPGLGGVVGRLAPRRPPRSGEGRGGSLLALAVALLLSLPLLAAGTPTAMLPCEVGDVLVGHFVLAGGVLLAGVRLRRPDWLDALLERPLATLLAAALGVLALLALLQPFGLVLHGVAFTPERAGVGLLAALGFLPFALAFNVLLRRGATRGASLAALAGRGVVLLVLVVGASSGALPRVVLLLLPAFAVVWLLIEALASSLYAVSRNVTVVALIDAAWLALVAAAILPIRI